MPKRLRPEVRFKERRAITYRYAQENRSLFNFGEDRIMRIVILWNNRRGKL
jgi:hypothetical protein